MRRRRPWIIVAVAFVLGAALAVVFQGCTDAPTIGYLCPDPQTGYDPRCTECANLSLPGCCSGYYDNEGNRIPPAAGCTDGGADGGDASASIVPRNGSCTGECVPALPIGWDGPTLVWLGPESMAPICPDSAPIAGNEWYSGLTAVPASCTACTCSPSSGTCSFPLEFTTSTSPCAAAGAPARTFDAPPGWDGSCTAYDPIVAGDPCNGGLCATSLSGGPLALNENGCVPSSATLADAAPPSWQTTALACSGTVSPLSMCDDPALTCAPSVAEAPGFQICIYQEGDNECPPSYSVKHLVYSSFTDARGCAPCTCGTSDGSCSARLDVYPDGTCTPPDPPFALVLTSAGPSCAAIDPPGSALGSKMLAALGYHPGACAPDGGQVVGAVEPSGAATFCCLS